MRAPIRIGMPPGTRSLWFTRYPSYWQIPVATNKDQTLGEFMRLHDNGMVERVIIRPDREDEDVYLIKPADAEIEKEQL